MNVETEQVQKIKFDSRLEQLVRGSSLLFNWRYSRSRFYNPLKLKTVLYFILLLLNTFFYSLPPWIANVFTKKVVDHLIRELSFGFGRHEHTYLMLWASLDGTFGVSASCLLSVCRPSSFYVSSFKWSHENKRTIVLKHCSRRSGVWWDSVNEYDDSSKLYAAHV